MKQKYNERRINKILKQKGKMSSDDALNELCRYFLGPDWYSMYSSHSDIACDIIYEYDEKGRLIKTIELNQT